MLKLTRPLQPLSVVYSGDNQEYVLLNFSQKHYGKLGHSGREEPNVEDFFVLNRQQHTAGITRCLRDCRRESPAVEGWG